MCREVVDSVAEEFEMVLVADDYPVAAHFGQFRGEAAAVESEVVCEFLSVEWDDKVAALVFHRLFGEVG